MGFKEVRGVVGVGGEGLDPGAVGGEEVGEVDAWAVEGVGGGRVVGW